MDEVAVVLTAVELFHCRNLLKCTIRCGLLGCLRFGAIRKKCCFEPSGIGLLVDICKQASLWGVYP